MFRNRAFRLSLTAVISAIFPMLACNLTLPPLDDLLDDLDPILTPDSSPQDSNPAGSPAQTTGRQALFDELWQTFDENYSYFDYKGIDWEDVRDRYRPDFAADLSDNEFTDQIVEMLAELHDLHVEVMYPDGTWVGTDPGQVELNYTSTPRNRYTLNDSGYQTLGNNVIWHAWYADSIAYVRIDTFSTTAFQNITQADVDDLFAQYSTADAMIVDIRPNNGGNENIAMEFASHFTAAEVVYGYTETRDGPDHWDFAPLETKTLQPATQNRFDGPVACLIGQRCLSSAEWFTLMMRACPNVTLIGDTTRGGSGFPREFELDNGVHYMVPRWVAYTDAMIEFEDVGIEPDIWIPADESFDESYDYVVETAISWLGP
ncbi:MAG: S41 family peptidase [Phycisphaerales bacterium]|nr:S41 family peptidase [Phycisphaerales bacterium]MCB9854147.1 S41 family peptidase [Phycisphaerales bacterium]MCB9864717.1 S41 family peptidase [Phycisphaerales bacterium]